MKRGGRHIRGSLRRRVHLALEGDGAGGVAGRLVEASLLVLIVGNSAAAVLATNRRVAEAYGPVLAAFEIVSVAIFTLEYGARLWCAMEDPRAGAGGPVAGRLGFAARPLMVIDLISILPAYAGFLFPGADPRIIGVLRLLRLLKIARYSPALQTLMDVVAQERRALFGTLLLLMIAVVFLASAMYLAEGSVQPKLFGSVPVAMWWAITTVGYGDAVPVMALGGVIGGLTPLGQI